CCCIVFVLFFFFSSRRRHTRCLSDWSSDVCSSDLLVYLRPTMSKVPADLKYTKSHEWVRALADGTVEVGITDHAQHALGDLVFVEVPEAGRAVKAGEPCAVVESVKAASDVYAPLAGEVSGGNGRLGGEPQVV